MDLISYIPGVGATASISPGPTTPAPYNVNHTGATDGSSPQTATLNMAEMYNRLFLEQLALIDSSGIGIDHNNWAQLPAAVRAIAQQVVNSSLSGGVVTTPQYNADFNGSFAANGWMKLKGFLIQWGFTAGPATLPSFFTTTFPMQFPNQCLQVIGGTHAAANLSYNIYETDVRLNSFGPSTATWLLAFVGDGEVGSGGAQKPGVHWVALGN
jgi:hypothetical protein